MPKEISAGAVIFRKEDKGIYYLLLHYESGHWDFAKGHVEDGEDEKRTVEREIEEETGIKDIKIINGFKERIKYSFLDKKNRNWIFKTVTFYLAETKRKEVNLSDEHIGFKWLDYKGAFKQLTFKNAKDILEKAHSLLSQKEKQPF